VVPQPLTNPGLGEEALSLGYDRVFFQDDCFTLTKGKVHGFCDDSERKLRFAVTKAMAQFYVRRYMGAASAPLFKPLERITDRLLRAMK